MSGLTANGQVQRWRWLAALRWLKRPEWGSKLMLEAAAQERVSLVLAK